MTYYVIMVKIYNDGTADKKSLYTYSTLDEALASYHSLLGGAINADTISSVMVKIVNSVGGSCAEWTGYWESSETSEE